MLWPTSIACSQPSLASSARIQSASASMDSRAGPAERPWPGKSGAMTFQPWEAK